MWKTAGVSGSMSPICLGRFITTSVTDIVTDSVLPVKGKRGSAERRLTAPSPGRRAARIAGLPQHRGTLPVNQAPCRFAVMNILSRQVGQPPGHYARLGSTPQATAQ